MNTHNTHALNPESDEAVVYRMVTDEHVCPFGRKAVWLLDRKGFEVADRHLKSRAETDAFKAEHDVETTPQAFVGGRRIGGYDALREHFDMPPAKPEGTTYKPVIAIFGVCALMAAALGWAALGTVLSVQVVEWFVALSMAVLAIQKLQDVEGFTNGFLGYDLLAQRAVPYAYVYPYLEGLAAVLMLGGVLLWLAIPVALFIGTIGAVSVIKAVYVDKRDIKCACVGGDSNVPLGFISLTENLFMIGMGLWMWLK